MNFNRVELAGNLTFDPELRQAGGTSVTELRMAVNRVWFDKEGQKKEEVLYIDATFWGKQAETACQYLHKGSNVFVEGNLKMDQWDDKNTGEKRSKIRVNGEKFHFLDKKSDGDGGGRQQGGYNDRQSQQQSRGGQPQGRGPAPSRGPQQHQGRGPQVQGFNQVDDEEVPF